MLIKALCDYYDVLAKKGMVLPQGYSKQKISYKIELSPDGRVVSIIDWRETVADKKGKEKKFPRMVNMPLPATNKSAIAASVGDCRAKYIFGLVGNVKNKNANEAHLDFVKVNKNFIANLVKKSVIVEAFSKFLEIWIPQNEKDNLNLVALGKDLTDTTGFVFCLEGHPEIMLHEDEDIVKAAMLQQNDSDTNDTLKGQCAVTGELSVIARLHNKIKGIDGGKPSGTSLICFNSSSEESYGVEQSFNSNISEMAMLKYTEALNILAQDDRHKVRLGDMTVLFWAMNAGEEETDLFKLLLQGNKTMSAEATENMLEALFKDAASGKVVQERISDSGKIDEKTDFYIVGIKPNSSRLAVKFICHRNFGQILRNVAQFQLDLMVEGRYRPVGFWQVAGEMISPKSSKEVPNSAIVSKIFEAVIGGYVLPESLLNAIVQRVKVDVGMDVTSIRAGIIKACLNRMCRLKNQKEVITMSLNKENDSPAYLCGRLFAVLEKAQQESIGELNRKLNRTIKDSYFAVAASKPSTVFAKLLQLHQYHMRKLQRDKGWAYVMLEKLESEIIDKLGSVFPGLLNLASQGEFILGYYQQKQDFFVKKEKEEK